MAKRLSPERLAVLLAHAPLELVEHVAWLDEENARLTSALEKWRDEVAAIRKCWLTGR